MNIFDPLPRYLRIVGGDGNADQSEQSGDQNDGGQANSDSGGDQNKQEADAPDKTAQDNAKRIGDLEAELDKERKDRIRMKRELDKRDAEKSKAAEQAELGDAEVEAERDRYKQQYEQLKAVVETQMLDWAIAIDKKYDWHDAEAVRAFINKSDIRLDLDNGKIEGLDLELKRIAKEKPYLMKAATNSQKQQDQQQNPPAAGTPNSGSHPFGGSAQQRETDKQKIAAKYKIFKHGSVSSV